MSIHFSNFLLPQSIEFQTFLTYCPYTISLEKHFKSVQKYWLYKVNFISISIN